MGWKFSEIRYVDKRSRTMFSNSFLKVHQALKTLASITERKTGNQKSSSKADKMLLTFLDNQLLGIMAHFSDVIDVSRDRQTTVDKKLCLHAVETLIVISKGHINIALPQVCRTHIALMKSELIFVSDTSHTPLCLYFTRTG